MQTYPKIRGSMPRESGPKVLVHRVLTPTPEDFIILSKIGMGVDFHWYANRSHECFAQNGEGTCDRCLKGWPLKWRCYLHCLKPEGLQSVQCFLELTKTAFSSLEFQTTERKSLRGVRIKVCKTAGGRKGRYIVQCQTEALDLKTTIEEIDPMPTLRALWEAPGRGGRGGGMSGE